MHRHGTNLGYNVFNPIDVNTVQLPREDLKLLTIQNVITKVTF